MLFQLNLILTAVLSGFMFSYALVLGNFLSYLVRKAPQHDFFSIYAEFRRERKVVILYRMVMLSQTLTALLSILLDAGQHALLPQIFALLCFPLLVLLHALSGYLPLEEKVNSAQELTKAETAVYLRWNVPLHTMYGLIYAAAALLLLRA